tara:strand:- start:11865 stop:12680 length:816 start_codon:yes stop_codon:yes gene_type:complete
MKKSTLKEAIKSKIKSLILEDLMTTDEAFRVLRDMQNIYVDKRKKDLMGRAIDALQAAEVSRMMDREPSFKGTGERAGFDMRGISEEDRVGKTIDKVFGGEDEEFKDFDPNDLDGDDIDDDRLRQRVQRLRHTGSNFDDLNESLNPEVTTAVNRFIKAMARKYGYEEQDAVYAIMAALEQRKSDTKYDMPGFGDTMDALDDISIREEEEPTSAELKKKDSIAATSNKLQKLTKKMKDKAKEFKAAEGDAKDKIKDELKKMTKEKKQLEKAL